MWPGLAYPLQYSTLIRLAGRSSFSLSHLDQIIYKFRSSHYFPRCVNSQNESLQFSFQSFISSHFIDRLDGLLDRHQVVHTVILPFFLRFIRSIFLLKPSKEYSTFKQFNNIAVDHQYHGSTLIITFLMRIFVDNSIYLALPTTFLVLLLMMSSDPTLAKNPQLKSMPSWDIS